MRCFLPSALVFFNLITPGLSQNYSMQTIAGRAIATEGGNATQSLLRYPIGVAVDSGGNVFIADQNDNRVWKVDPNGKITTLAGNGTPFYGGDNGPGPNAALNNPMGIAVDSSNNVYICDAGNARVRKVTPAGIITTVAGSGAITSSGDGGPAVRAGVLPMAIAVDKNGNLFISEGTDIREVNAATGNISTIAGSQTPGYSGDNGQALNARLATVTGIAVDSPGNLYLADWNANVIRKIDTKNVITTIGGTGVFGYSGDGAPATTAKMDPYALALDPSGAGLYLSEPIASTIRRIDFSTGKITIVAGTFGHYGFAGDGLPALQAVLFGPYGLATNAANDLIVCDTLNQRVRRLPAFTSVSTIAGTSSPTFLNHPEGIGLDAKGNLNVADTGNNVVKQLNLGTGIMTSLPAYFTLNPEGVAEDSSGNLYMNTEGTFGSNIYKFSTTSQYFNFAGTGDVGFSGDNGVATRAMVGRVTSVISDSSNNIYIADYQNSRIRKIDTQGNITTIAGNGNSGASGDGGKATSAGMDPFDMAIDRSGNFYVVDRANNRIRKFTPGGNISTFAGTGAAGVAGDNGPAISAMLDHPSGVAVDPTGNVYIADAGNAVLRKVTTDGVIHTIAGDGVLYPFTGDGPALQQNLSPFRVAVDNSGTIYLSDWANDRIRKLVPVNAASLTIAAGNNQTGTTGTALSQKLTVMVTGTDNNPYAGASVTFVVTSGDASIAPATVQTANDGTASAVLTLGSAQGPITVSASVGGLSSVTFSVTSTPAITPAAVVITAGDKQSGITGTALNQKLIVKVMGTDGNAYTGATVTFAVTSGSATLNPATPQKTAADGTASVVVTLGATAGPVAISASVAGLAPVTFSLNATSPVAASALSIVSGDKQTGIVGAALGQKLIVKVTGTDNNPFVGATVTFAVATGSATLNPSTPQQTGADGTASATVTLGNTAGPVTITTSVNGLASVTFSLTATTAQILPQISTGGIVSAGLSSPAIQAASPNAILSIFGQNFAPAGTFRKVAGSDLVNGLVPTNLIGVCVTFGDQRAPMFLVTQGQLNVQAPALPASGTVQVQVIANCDTPDQAVSNTLAVSVQAAAPEFFYSSNNADGKNPIAATDGVTGAGIGDPARLGAGFAMAYPGEVIQIYATGFGLTDPAFAPGQLPSGAASVSGISVSIDGTMLPASAIQYAGVAPLNAGLYQLNIAIPTDLSVGDHTITMSINGANSPAGSYLSVGPAPTSGQ